MKKLIFWCSMQGIIFGTDRQSATNLVETLCTKEPLCILGKQSFSHPTPSTQCCATVPATCTKQQPPQH